MYLLVLHIIFLTLIPSLLPSNRWCKIPPVEGYPKPANHFKKPEYIKLFDYTCLKKVCCNRPQSCSKYKQLYYRTLTEEQFKKYSSLKNRFLRALPLDKLVCSDVTKSWLSSFKATLWSLRSSLPSILNASSVKKS